MAQRAIFVDIASLLPQEKPLQTNFKLIEVQASSYFGDDAIISYDDVWDVKKLRETIFGYLVVNSTVHRDDIYDKSDYQHTNINVMQLSQKVS